MFKAPWFAGSKKSWWWPKGGTSGSILTVNGISVINKLLADSLIADQNISNRGGMDFTINVDNVDDVPKVGQEVILDVYRCAIGKFRREFGGTIETVDYDSELCDGEIEVKIQAVDFNQIPDKRTIARSYENVAIAAMVQDISFRYLDGDLITTDGIDLPSKDFTKAVFSYIPVTKAFDDIANITGTYWYIDYNKKLNFFLRSQRPVTATISSNCLQSDENELCVVLTQQGCAGTGVVLTDVKIKKTREQLRNEQFVVAGFHTTPLRTEEFAGDGIRRTFTLSIELADVPRDSNGDIDLTSIKVGGVAAASISLGEEDPEAEWWIEKGSKEVTQNDFPDANGDPTVLPVGDGTEIEVLYKGLRKVIVKRTRPESQRERQVIEKNSGIYSHVINDESIEDAAYANAYADGLLDRFDKVATFIEFTSDEIALDIGDVVDVDIPEYGIASFKSQGKGFLITQRKVFDIATKTFRMSYKAVDGEFLGGWQDFFKKIEFFGHRLQLNEQATLLTISITDDDVGEIDDDGNLVGDGGFQLTCSTSTDINDLDAPDLKYTQTWAIGYAIVGRNAHRRVQYELLGFDP